MHANGDDVQFQRRGDEKESGLLVYHASQRTIYVYQGVMTGNPALQCSYKFKLGEAGGIRRQECDVQRLIP